MTKILDGKTLSLLIAEKLKVRISRLKQKPKIVIIQVGNKDESNAYIRNKLKFAEKIGAVAEHVRLAETVSEMSLLSHIEKLNRDKSVHGIIVQLPLPKQLDERVISQAVLPEKAVDGSAFFLPATTRGILTLLDHYKIPIAGKKAVVVGRSELVGKPTALALLNRDATVTVCHSKTKNIAKETKQADILVVAAGKPKLITAQHISKHQVVIDVGINMVNGKMVGDVDFEKVSKIVSAISPVPGGVGPMTVASLFENLLDAYALRK
ncbi:bifunctional 5,10-methylenetetrahydrofolate dehydrogenase/5,10-methenyltetrahydrofolate cyclohydrolase [Candidatus Parcubacteria bacterium]|nr:bifunctional 5,10-methylenetetrahydrofolate dehydrogenase/5,10-methenyltetrahydrofolate cyclohydrolase [Candidatus Parcubacteria bacterium]